MFKIHMFGEEWSEKDFWAHTNYVMVTQISSMGRQLGNG